MEKPIRQHFAGLPYQISHFDRVGEVIELLSIEHLAPSAATSPRMDDEGNIFFDRTFADRAAEYISGPSLPWPLRDYLDRVRDTRDRRVQQLGEAQRLAAEGAPALVTIEKVGDAISALVPYGLVTKILPDAIQGVIRDRLGKNSDLHELQDTDAAGPEPELVHRMQARIIPRLISASRNQSPGALESVCSTSRGLGPHAWEAPGYETLGFVRALANTQAALKESPASERPAPTPSRRDLLEPDVLSLIEHYHAWLQYTDAQTIRLRQAFYESLRGALSLQSVVLVSAGQIEQPTDIFFCRRGELTGKEPFPSESEISLRKQRYNAITSSATYPNISEKRLEQILSEHPYVTDELVPVAPAPSAAERSGTSRVLAGLSVSSRDSVRGNALPLMHLEDALGMAEGAILVAKLITPDMAPLFPKAAGVVVEEGGLTQHATILAREYGIPCIVGVEDAMALIGAGHRIHLFGATGEVLVGETVEAQTN